MFMLMLAQDSVSAAGCCSSNVGAVGPTAAVAFIMVFSVKQVQSPF